MHYSYPQAQARRQSANDYAPFEVRRCGRYWEVRDAAGQLVCLTVYRRGAAEVIRRLKLDQAPDEGSRVDTVEAGSQILTSSLKFSRLS